ncbi:aBC transporter ATP-binding protein [Clostridium sp. CAG:1193]|nr:aBC transporter ATP-binding protein [Clostridium sp. CAG:1193]
MFKLIKKLGKKELLYVLISALLIVFQVWLDLKLPDYMNNITTLLQTEGSNVKDLFNPGSKMLLCALGSLASSIVVGYFVANVASNFSRKIRKEVFTKVEDFSMEEIKKFSTSSLITRTTNDITQVQMLISMGLQLMIKSPVTAVWAICKISGKSYEWSIATGGAVLCLLMLISVVIIFALPRFKRVQKLTDNLNRITMENLKGIRVVRAYNAEKYEKNKFDKANNELTNTHLFIEKIMSIISPWMSLIMSTLTLSIYAIGIYLLNKAALTDKVSIFSNMIVFSSYAMQVVMSFMMLAIVFVMFPRASVSAKRILEVLETDVKIKSGSFKEDTNIKGEVEFKNVSFKYPDAEEYVLKNISFKASKGETIAFIGRTGCGKSTLINLIPRFYDATEGEILIDGVNVKDYDLEYLHNKLGYIPQKAVMFNGTVKENVAYGSNGKKFTKEKIERSIKIAQAKDFVSKMDKDIDSHIASGGTNISGGQKQRLAIARAIARDPEIYIFDDSFSALDYKTDYVLRKDLKKYTKDATTFIVAQRIGTIKNADKILVLEEGKCVGIGTHEELLKKCKEYKEIALSQFGKEEL